MESPGLLIFTQGSVYPSCLIAGYLEKARGNVNLELSREASVAVGASCTRCQVSVSPALNAVWRPRGKGEAEGLGQN